jgi:hypothetical protein
MFQSMQSGNLQSGIINGNVNVNNGIQSFKEDKHILIFMHGRIALYPKKIIF